jgi:hypothetical protein
MKRPIVEVVRLKKKGRLCPALSDKTIAPPGVAIHWADRHRASLRPELLASMAQYVGSGIFIRGCVVPDEPETLAWIRGSFLPPEGTAGCERGFSTEQNPMSIRGIVEKIFWSQRRNIPGNFAG